MAINASSPQNHRSLLYLETEIPAASRGNIEKYANFDKNMIIVFSALLSELIFALALKSIMRCALRFGQRFSSADDHQQMFVVRPAAADSSVIGFRNDQLGHGKNIIDGDRSKKRLASQIPEIVCGSLEEGMKIPVTECLICLAEFEGRERVRILPGCNHGIHVECIDAWLRSFSSCPICRRCLDYS